MSDSWDVFFSYRRSDLERAQPLLDALAQSRVRVWLDKADIPDFASITAGIRQGIAKSKALLAFYSKSYPLSNPCQQEIAAAWLAAQQIDGHPNRRVWIVNPDDGFGHLPRILQDQQIPHANANCLSLAAEIKSRVDGLDGDLGRGVRDLPRYYGMAPVQAQRFVGRAAALWDLHGQLTANQISIISGKYGQAASQVRGLGGNGKSLLAREYAIRFGSAYPGGVFWLNAFGNDDTGKVATPEQLSAARHDQLRDFATNLHVSVEGLDPKDLEAALWQAIASRGDRCLWVVDDVASGLTPADFERDWTARWPRASTLITTRSKDYGALGEAIDLGVLSSSEAFHLLCAHRQPTSESDVANARKITELLGYHPLAVEVAGSYLAQGLDTFQSYQDALTDPAKDAVEFGNELQESLPTGHERSISVTLLKSIRRLGPDGLDFLRLASVLAVAPIAVSFVAEVLESVAGDGKSRALRGTDEVRALSLCESPTPETRTVHTLVSRTMWFQCPDDKRTELLCSVAGAVLVVRFANVGHIGEHSKIANDVPHARHFLVHDVQGEILERLAIYLARLDQQRGDYGPARRLQEQALASLKRASGNEHPETLAAVGNLAGTLMLQGDLAAARKLQEPLLAASKKVLGEEHRGTLTVMLELSRTLFELGDLAGAAQLQEIALATSRRLFGDTDIHTLNAMIRLGATRGEQGNLECSRSLQEHALELLRRRSGDEHPDTTMAMINLAQTLYRLGDLAGARKLQEQALATSRRLWGDENPHTLIMMDNLALTRYAGGEVDQARVLQEKVLPALRRQLGDEHPQTLTAMVNFAQTLCAQRALNDARKLQEEALVRLTRLLGYSHPKTLAAMNNLALTLHAIGDLVGARRLQEKTLAESRRLLGDCHTNTLTTINNLALTLRAQGDFPGARKLLAQALAKCRRLLGDEHAATLIATNNLAAMLYAQGDIEGARKVQERTLAVRRQRLRNQHSSPATAMNDPAEMQSARGFDYLKRIFRQVRSKALKRFRS